MKKMFAAFASLILLTGALAGCGQRQETSRTPEELTQLYAQAITQYGGEMAENNPVISRDNSEENMNAMILESMGLKTEDMTAFAVSGSMMNV